MEKVTVPTGGLYVTHDQIKGPGLEFRAILVGWFYRVFIKVMIGSLSVSGYYDLCPEYTYAYILCCVGTAFYKEKTIESRGKEVDMAGLMGFYADDCG
jgi:hypothetical protein